MATAVSRTIAKRVRNFFFILISLLRSTGELFFTRQGRANLVNNPCLESEMHTDCLIAVFELTKIQCY
jgi:hypothetical protein